MSDNHSGQGNRQTDFRPSLHLLLLQIKSSSPIPSSAALQHCSLLFPSPTPVYLTDIPLLTSQAPTPANTPGQPTGHTKQGHRRANCRSLPLPLLLRVQPLSLNPGSAADLQPPFPPVHLQWITQRVTASPATFFPPTPCFVPPYPVNPAGTAWEPTGHSCQRGK